MNETSNEMQLAQQKYLSPEVMNMQAQWMATVQTAQSMQLAENSCAAFQAVVVVQMLRQALTDGVMQSVFMPLMNTKIGFKTDKDPKRAKQGQMVQPYPVDVVRDCLIDAMCIGLLPTGNQFNIIAGTMYPTKEGYTALLKRIGCKYIISVEQDRQPKDAPFAEIPCKINYDRNGEKGGYTFIATVKKDGYSSMDQLRGKAERRAKKSLYEYLTGCDFGEADEQDAVEVQVVSPQQSAAQVMSKQNTVVSFEAAANPQSNVSAQRQPQAQPAQAQRQAQRQTQPAQAQPAQAQPMTAQGGVKNGNGAEEPPF